MICDMRMTHFVQFMTQVFICMIRYSHTYDTYVIIQWRISIKLYDAGSYIFARCRSSDLWHMLSCYNYDRGHIYGSWFHCVTYVFTGQMNSKNLLYLSWPLQVKLLSGSGTRCRTRFRLCQDAGQVRSGQARSGQVECFRFSLQITLCC